MAKEFSNSGLTVLNPSAPGTVSTIIAVGVPRSGTSMVGAVLDALDVPLGSTADRAVFEDTEIAGAIEGRNVDVLKTLIAQRDAQHAIWGFKRPMAFAFLPEYLPLFRNPRVIVTFRDPAAIAKRNEISMATPFLDVLNTAAESTLQLVASIRQMRCPILAISYEKALADPQTLLSEMISFCGLSPTRKQIKNAAAVIQNGPEAYVQNSRVWYEGSFDGVGGQVARGWARCMPMNSPCPIEIWDENQCIGRGQSDRSRTDLTEIGDRAFEVPLASKPGKTVSARVAGTTVALSKTKAFNVA